MKRSGYIRRFHREYILCRFFRLIDMNKSSLMLWSNHKFDNLTCFEAVTSLNAILEFLAAMKS